MPRNPTEKRAINTKFVIALRFFKLNFYVSNIECKIKTEVSQKSGHLHFLTSFKRFGYHLPHFLAKFQGLQHFDAIAVREQLA
jgi:hypothetical protein